MTRLANPVERSAFIVDFKGQASIGQAWVKMQTESKPSVGLASLQQTEKKVTLCLPTKTGEARSRSTWQKVSCHKSTVKDTSLRGWQHVIFCIKGYDGDPLRCLGPEEAKEMIKEVHPGECGEYQGKKKLYRCLLQMSYYWPTMKKDIAEFVKKCHSCQVQANLINTYS